MKVGAGRDYDLKIFPGTSPKGEAGLLLVISRWAEKMVVFIGKPELEELLGQLKLARFELEQRKDNP